MNVLIGVTGGVAAYKVCEVVSTLAKSNQPLQVLMTQQAEAFVSPMTFAALSRQSVYTDRDFWSSGSPQIAYRPLHITLGEWADIVLIAPLTANTLAKLVYGLADNLLTNTLLASRCPVLLAPAMNTDMWQQEAVARNWQQLLANERFHAVGPGSGRLACDRVGEGRMAEPTEILSALHSLLHTQGKRDLRGKHILISTGSTREYLDPVRFIGNPATGRMGIALALAALHRGAAVKLVHGPLASELVNALPGNIETTAVTTAAEMEQAMLGQQAWADWIIMAAAVADVRPMETAANKLPKHDLPQCLPLSFVPDIVSQLTAHKAPGQIVVGFAAQTGDIVPPAQEKLQRKQLDVVVANPVDKPGSGFGSVDNEAVILSVRGKSPQKVALTSKLNLAHYLYDYLIG